MYDIFKPRVLQFVLPPRILVGIGGSGTLSIDSVARDAAAAAQASIDAITAQTGETVPDGYGVMSSDGKLYINKTGTDVTLSGAASADLSVDGLTPVGSAVSNNLLMTLDNVSQMVSSTDVEVGSIVEVSGYYAEGDGGRNRYEIVAPGTGTADGGAYIDLNGTGLQAKALFPDGCTLEQWGAVKNGSTDDTSKLQAALDWCSANGVKSLRSDGPSGKFAISGRVQMQPNVRVDFNYNEVAPLSDDAGFVLARYGSLENLTWTAESRQTWTGPMMIVNESTNSSITTYPRLRNVTCLGYKDTVNNLVSGVMLSLDATAGTRVCGVRGSGLYASDLESVVEFKASASGLSGWVNSNHFEFDMIYNCNRCFIMDRLDTDREIANNYIKASYQPGSTEQAEILLCNGTNNDFDLLIWDLGAAGDPDIIKFEADSESNLVRGSFNPMGVRDNGISSNRNEVINRTFPTLSFAKKAMEPSSTSSGTFLGHVDNCLAYADKRYSVTAPATSSGYVSTLFKPNMNARAIWSGLTSLVIDIDLLASYSALRTLGIAFADSFVPDTVMFETSSDGTNWNEVATLPGSQLVAWTGRGFIGGSFQYIRVTVTTTESQEFSVAQIFGWWKNMQQGGYLPTGGGTLYGDTTLADGKSANFISPNGSATAAVSADNSNRLSVAATGGIKLNGTKILSDQQPSVTNPSGGSTVDAECRAAVIALADRLRSHGLIEN